ncbi:SGNH/GDSL hydrolase family protein [Adlercreutzia faecimuris]|uniref:SGNH/GDSL hydrolase family protein n=1 Tax=Adlercreutzia faecimuris TaxID=2897341 RepID=A0ABS9WK64_9ACTN|nr:SGNH/GDSL hydrolase family protein [Adlercreutzia sp. JBNU-10]MCI2242776.1 SGNH/GDSL hydrolase family protein [Adlercreutzia sp. JBNU-10]
MAQRSFSIFGDSISTFERVTNPANRIYYKEDLRAATGVEEVGDTWWAQVIARLGGRLLANASFSGSMAEGAGFPAGCSSERIAQVAGPDGEAPDDILVFIGINDYGWAGARAQAAARSEAMPRCPEALAVPEGAPGPATAASLSGFARAYGEMLAGLRAAYPAARVWCLTLLPGREVGAAGPSFAYQLRGIDLDDYNDAIRAAARAHGCEVADIRAAGFDYEALDGTHPTRRGMAQLAELTLAAMSAPVPSVSPADGGASAPGAVGSRASAPDVAGKTANAPDAAGEGAGAPGAAGEGAGVPGIAGEGAGAPDVPAPVTVDEFGVRDAGLNVSRETFVALPADLFPAEMRSRRRCMRSTCFDCEFARSTGVKWSCVCELP